MGRKHSIPRIGTTAHQDIDARKGSGCLSKHTNNPSKNYPATTYWDTAGFLTSIYQWQ
jgi:hypothetical protein